MRQIANKAIYTLFMSIVVSGAFANYNLAKADTITSEASTAAQSTQQITTTQQVPEKESITVQTPAVKRQAVQGKQSLVWKKDSQVTGYEVWVKSGNAKNYKKKSSTSKVSYSLSKLAKGTVHNIKVRAYRTYNKKTYYSKFSTPEKILTNVTLKSVKSTEAGTICVKWKAQTGVSGYQIQYSKNSSFKKPQTIKVDSKKDAQKNIYELVQKKKYYVRIRTYKTSGKNKIYSAWSGAKSCTVKDYSAIVNGGYKDTDGFFKDSVFFGDSVLSGLGIYVKNKGKGYLDNAKVMGTISYSLIAALQTNSNLHPLYKGKHMAPEYVTKALKAKKVFLFFGINDIYNTKNPKLTFSNYKKLIARIEKVNPGVEIYIIGATYPIKNQAKDKKLAANLKTFNEMLRDYCEKTDYGYIDIASYISTKDGYLKNEYCSDNFLHQNISTYSIWDKVLRNYAWNKNH